MIRKLVAKGFLKEVGRSDMPGRPILYKTTDEFLDYFGLSSKEELPKLNITSDEESSEETDLFLSRYKEE
jgi:segregation and condensation protein B